LILYKNFLTLSTCAAEKWTVPQFGGASYAEYPRVESFSTTTINMSLRSFDPEGLLLYAYLESRNDFLSLAINLGYLEFR